LGIDPVQIRSFAGAQTALVRALDWLFVRGKLDKNGSRSGLSPRVLSGVKSAVSILFSLRFPNKPKLSTDTRVQAAVNFYYRQKPPLQTRPELKFKLDHIRSGFAAQGLPHELTMTQLTGKTICLLRAFRALRSTEVAQLRRSTKPSADGKYWDFDVRIKRRKHREVVRVYGHSDARLCPVAHLLELKNRLKNSPARHETDSFWINQRGRKASVQTIRSASRTAMLAIGVDDSKSYHLKHAAATALADAGVPITNIKVFLRHCQNSTTAADRYIDVHKDKQCVDVVMK
jgi:hypothetical protein